MRALLLAGGMGTRLRPITDTVPKCLVPIAGRPLLGLWLDAVFRGGVEQAVVNTHYLSAAVEAFMAGSRWRDRVTLFHERELLGTGGTLKATAHLLGPAPWLVLHADNLSDLDVAGFRAAHEARPEGTVMTMALFRTDSPRSCGIVELDSEGRVVDFHEKVENPPGNLANAAAYIMEAEVLDLVEARGRPFVDLSTEILPALMGRIATYTIEGYHRDIGTSEALAAAERDVADGLLTAHAFDRGAA